MDVRIQLEENLVTLAFVQQRCYALRSEVEKLREELKRYKVEPKQEVVDDGRS